MKHDHLDPWADRAQVRAIWESMSASKEVPYQLTWAWVESWLDSLPQEGVRLKCVVIYKDGAPACAFFAGRKTITRRKLVHSRCIFINATGDDEYDSLCLEYNRFLKNPDVEIGLQDIVTALGDGWDELAFPGFCFSYYDKLDESRLEKKCRLLIDKDVPAPCVDLERVRESEGGYLALLGSSTRSQIRKSYKSYSQKGKVELLAADTIPAAEIVYKELVEIHQEAWNRRGKPGAFYSSYFFKFHLDLIRKRFDKGEIQLLKVVHGDATIGCLYNFIHEGRVYFYQSGFVYDGDGKIKPGYVCFNEAIEYNARIGNMCFDFMGGSSDYKRRLGQDGDRVIWFRLQKRSLKFALEDLAVSAYRAMKRGARSVPRLKERLMPRYLP